MKAKAISAIIKIRLVGFMKLPIDVPTSIIVVSMALVLVVSCLVLVVSSSFPLVVVTVISSVVAGVVTRMKI